MPVQRKRFRLLVTGSRSYDSKRAVRKVLNAYLELCGWLGVELYVIVGDCPTGADLFTRDWCMDNNVSYADYEADWIGLGEAAVPERNRRMVDDGMPDDCVAFFQQGARNAGTQQCSDYAEARKVRTFRIRSQD